MNVIQENVDALNAILKIQITPEDYKESVDKSLKNYRKTANIPGFRKGNVPMSYVQKRFGKSVLAEEMNKVINKSLHDYIEEKELNILGNPLPKANSTEKGDWDNPADFEFEYEIGLAPEFDIKLSAKNKYDFIKVKIDNDLIEKQIDDLSRRYGKLVGSDKVGDKDMIMAQFVELNDDDSIKPGGVLNSSTISMEFVEDKKVAKSLTGKVVGDKIIVDPSTVSRGEKDTAAMLGIKEEELANISNKFQMTINEIRQMEKAEMNQELFDKLYGEGTISTEKEMREKISTDLEGMFGNDSERIMSRDISEDLMKKTDMTFPDAFLKRWIQTSNQNEISMEQIENEYEGYTKGLKWQLIQNKIFKDNDLAIQREDAMNYTKGLLVNQYAQYGIPTPEDNELTQGALKVLENQEEAQRIYGMLAETKMIEFYKKTVKLNEKEVSYDEFVKIAQGEK
jgi:trigger factor